MLSRSTLKFVRASRSVATIVPACTARFFSAGAEGEAHRTALYDVHVKSGGKMVTYEGYSLPVQYGAEGINASHHFIRESAGLFDVSHMGQITITGTHRVALMEKCCTADIAGTKNNLAKLSVLTTKDGGVIDDMMVTPKEDHLFVVFNAGCKEKDMAHVNEQIELFNAANPAPEPVKLHYHADRSLLALQGPKAAEVMAKLVPDVDLPEIAFMNTFNSVIDGIPVGVTRCGYTGEDGFEISCHNDDAEKLWNVLLGDQSVVHPAGLGVRDSLRLDAGLCLYGHELDETISPIEAGLTFVVAPRRRKEGGFLGAEKILHQIANGVERKLIGLEIKSGAPARAGTLILDKDGNEIGSVTSGGPSPTLNKKIALGYVKTPFATAGTEVQVSTRGKLAPAEVVKTPFFPSRFYRKPKPAATA